MQDSEMIFEDKLEKLAEYLSKEFTMSQEEAFEIIYEEWDIVETLMYRYKKAELVKDHFVKQINELYRIA